jgi:hypothetical protein
MLSQRLVGDIAEALVLDHFELDPIREAITPCGLINQAIPLQDEVPLSPFVVRASTLSQ